MGGAHASRVLVALRKEFGRRARNRVGQISWLTGFRRDAENGNRDGRAPRRKATMEISQLRSGWGCAREVGLS